MRLTFLLLALLAAGVLAADEFSPLEPSAAGQVVRDSNYRYLVSQDELGWADLERVRQSEDWRRPRTDTLNRVNPGTLWIEIPLAPAPEGLQDWRLELRWPDVERVEASTWVAGRGLGEIHSAGTQLPLSELDFVHKNIVFPVSLAASEPAMLYLRITERGFAFLPMMLYSAEQYESHNSARTVLFSMAFGIMAVMILYNIALYLAVRDRMYLFYSNAVFSSLLYLLAVSGYGRITLWAGNEWMEAHASGFFAAYCFLAVTWFFRIFLDLPSYGGWMLKANNFFLLAFSAALVFSATPLEALAIASLGPLSLLSSAVGLVTAICVWRLGNASAKYFILAWTGVMAATVMVVLTLMGAIRYFPALEYAQMLSFVVEIVLLSLALADRIRRQRLAKEEAQASLLKVQEETNAQLESKVQLRTQELESAMVDLKSANRELSKLTKIDALTKVNNRRHFDQIGANEIARAQRKGCPLSVIMVDIDRFKAINDTHGHVVGDKCLKLVASCLAQNLGRATDVVARYGGEEFALILPETDEAGALAVAELIRLAVEELFLAYDGRTVRMTASFGVCSRVPRARDTITAFVADADAALYLAKENGRNRVEMHTSSAGRPADLEPTS